MLAKKKEKMVKPLRVLALHGFGQSAHTMCYFCRFADASSRSRDDVSSSGLRLLSQLDKGVAAAAGCDGTNCLSGT